MARPNTETPRATLALPGNRASVKAISIARGRLASCFATTKEEDQELQLAARYFNFNAVGVDDIYIEECLRLGGTWQAVALQSP